MREHVHTELGNSETALPAQAGREHASVQDRGRRQRSSQRPVCNGLDKTKDCQESAGLSRPPRSESAASSTALFSGTAGDRTQRVVPCLRARSLGQRKMRFQARKLVPITKGLLGEELDAVKVCAVSRRVEYLPSRERLGAMTFQGKRVLLQGGNFLGDGSMTRSGET